MGMVEKTSGGKEELDLLDLAKTNNLQWDNHGVNLIKCFALVKLKLLNLMFLW